MLWWLITHCCWKPLQKCWLHHWDCIIASWADHCIQPRLVCCHVLHLLLTSLSNRSIIHLVNKLCKYSYIFIPMQQNLLAQIIHWLRSSTLRLHYIVSSYLYCLYPAVDCGTWFHTRHLANFYNTPFRSVLVSDSLI